MNASSQTPSTGSASAGAKATGRWMALVAALLGWLFDGFEIGMFPLVGRPALGELLGDGLKLRVDRCLGGDHTRVR